MIGVFVTALASASLVNAAAPVLQSVSPNVPVTSTVSLMEGWINGGNPLSGVVVEFDQNITLTGSVLTHTITSKIASTASASGSNLTVSFSAVETDKFTLVIPKGAVVNGSQEANTAAIIIQYYVIQGDVTHDGKTTTADVIRVAQRMGKCEGDSGFDPDADLNADGCITSADSSIISAVIGLGLAIPTNDMDGDGAGDSFDNCLSTFNADQANNDGDAFGNACENCDDDPNKTDPGVCGCGKADVDTDGDGFLDCEEECPNDKYKTLPGLCGCGKVDVTDDDDADGVIDCIDNCLDLKNPGQEDADSDDVGDDCDNCPDTKNTDQTNSDTDEFGDACDNCPGVENANQADQDSDGFGDVCDSNPTVSNPNQNDLDADGVDDDDDLCPNTAAHQVVDANGCGFFQRDDDGDGVLNGDDLCPETEDDADVDSNGCSEEQLNNGDIDTTGPSPGHPVGDENDDDGDSITNDIDQCPNTPAGTTVNLVGCEVLDTNSNGQPNQEPGDTSNCGAGAPCGALGLANVYFFMLGLAWIKSSRRKRQS